MTEARSGLPAFWAKNKRTIVAALLAVLFVASATALWGEDLWRLISDEQAVENLVARAGILGPLLLIAFGALQVVVAPIPGYAVGLAAGYLYGPWWGGVYAAAGMLLGGMIAMWLGRTFGRPGVQWIVGRERLTRWENVTHSTSPVVWFILLLGPMGDIPFFLAGLSSVPYFVILAIALVIRVPSVFLSTAIGGGALSPVWLAVTLGIATVLVAVAWIYRTPMTAWYDRQLEARLEGKPELVPAAVHLPASDEKTPQ